MSGNYLAGPQGLLWSINARAVLDVIDREGPLGRPEITRATGLSKTTVAQALRELVARRVVEEAGADTTRRGPAATLYRVAPRCALGLGVDIGHLRIRAVLVDAVGKTLAQAETRAPRRRVADTAAAVAALAAECAGRAGTDPGAIGQAVVGVPAVVARDGRTVRRAYGLPQGGRGLAEEIERDLPVPLLLENDVNLAAVAEQRFGACADVADFVLLGVGVGLGAGIVLGGRLHRGFAGGAGEVGFLPHPATELGTEVLGARRIAEQARQAGIEGTPSPREIFESARGGDERALAVVDATARRIAHVAASIALVIEPELFVLGGAFGASADLLLGRIRRHLARDAAPLPIRIIASGVPEDAVLRGAAWLARHRARERAFAGVVGGPPYDTTTGRPYDADLAGSGKGDIT
ncbi:ROK family transcriptional regulator [Microbispora sp. NPDC046933]|uniref:ROK family transcriptional regulator n=1 Tax=Microbispora sp. NPDC046933 TaxID=3155618 RepID=UPI0033C0B0FE